MKIVTDVTIRFLTLTCLCRVPQTCGSASAQDSCSSTSCGGLGCVDSEGRPKCGGEGCGGLLTTAKTAWVKARDSEREIINAIEEVEKLSKMVSSKPSATIDEFLSELNVLTCPAGV